MNALFESVTLRSGGFAVFNQGGLGEAALFVAMGLMFIGGASGSTAGGIKVNTFTVFPISIASTVRGASIAQAFAPAGPTEVIYTARCRWPCPRIAFVFTVARAMEILAGGLPFVDTIFEAISAFVTVGLSTGITTELPEPARVLLAAAMFVGRLGPYTGPRARLGRRTADLHQPALDRCGSVDDRVDVGGTRDEATVLVIGLGRFGTAAAQELMALGHEVLADRDETRVNDIAPDVTSAVQADASDAEALEASAPPTSGTRSWRSAATPSRASSRRWSCAPSGSPTSWPRPDAAPRLDPRAGRGDPGRPEREMGARIAHAFASRHVSTTSTSLPGFGIVRFAVPPDWAGRTLGEVDPAGRGLTAVALRQGAAHRVARRMQPRRCGRETSWCSSARTTGSPGSSRPRASRSERAAPNTTYGVPRTISTPSHAARGGPGRRRNMQQPAARRGPAQTSRAAGQWARTRLPNLGTGRPTGRPPRPRARRRTRRAAERPA